MSGGRNDELRRARVLFVGGERAGPPGGAGPATPGGVRVRLRKGLKKLREAARRWTSRRELWCVPAGIALGLLGRSVLPVVVAVVAMALVRRRLRAREGERERARRGDAVIELCEAVAGELRAGRQPGQALVASGVAGFGEAGAAVVAARFGGDVPQALRAVARMPGAEGLAGVAACWQVAVDGGAGLAAGLERIASGLRARRDQRDDLRAQLAGPRATALMLALLPAGGVALGSALGADPLRVLLHTPAGWACLLVGGLLEWCGVAWTARIIRAAEGSAHVH
ncbi:hypothetical protein CP973_38215 [Streptomyces albofaciens JCM 4342]|nr:hypothetical protein CP973_38215 [Streptomyces albofaciens JCM 4342]